VGQRLSKIDPEGDNEVTLVERGRNRIEPRRIVLGGVLQEPNAIVGPTRRARRARERPIKDLVVHWSILRADVVRLENSIIGRRIVSLT
jgi:hypothetical protein